MPIWLSTRVRANLPMRAVRPGVLIADTSFLLAGGAILLARRLTARPTEDLVLPDGHPQC
jgi:hypothetical protein